MKDNKATARNCGFEVRSCRFLLKRRRLKVAPRHLLINLKCTVTINLIRSRAWGQVLLKLEETALSGVLILVTDGIWGMCIFYLLS